MMQFQDLVMLYQKMDLKLMRDLLSQFMSIQLISVNILVIQLLLEEVGVDVRIQE